MVLAAWVLTDPLDSDAKGIKYEQLEQRFGYLLTLAEASPDLRSCYLDSDCKSHHVLFIDKSGSSLRS
jgi:hypothetical protein